MGTQINIAHKDMLKAGWLHGCHQEPLLEIDNEGNEVVGSYTEYFYEKVINGEPVRLYSYSDNSFSADCNHWGNNITLFKELGLFELPHVLS